MSTKKLGIWAGGVAGLFAVLLLLMYFLYPYISPAKAARVEKEQQSKVKTPSFGYEKPGSPSPDRLSQKVIHQKMKIDSLTTVIQNKAHIIDSLEQAMNDKQEAKAAAKESGKTDAKKVSQLFLQPDGKPHRTWDAKRATSILKKGI